MPRMSPFLCLRRGVSRLVDEAPVSGCFSLPTQRCFPPRGFPFRSNRLFSAYAEVFPSVPQRSGRDRSFLCLRRGVSRVQTDLWNLLYFSLPTQRCFCRRIQCRHCRGLFSAYAEVFPLWERCDLDTLSFLCLRRGVSSLVRRLKPAKARVRKILWVTLR